MHISCGECHDAPEGWVSIAKVGTDFENVPMLMDRAYEGDETRKLLLLMVMNLLCLQRKTVKILGSMTKKNTSDVM
jgi:hypothetical protein